MSVASYQHADWRHVAGDEHQPPLHVTVEAGEDTTPATAPTAIQGLSGCVVKRKHEHGSMAVGKWVLRSLS